MGTVILKSLVWLFSVIFFSGLHIKTGGEMSDKVIGLLTWFGVIIYFIALLYFTF